MNKRQELSAYLATHKREIVENEGCNKCGRGQGCYGFERYWGMDFPYNARRFVFKYSDPRESDVPVAQLPKLPTTTTTIIDEALARCVILCRSCSDPRRTRKGNDQCQKTTQH
jgi:hypothetical protein